jgi:hypothetical protein
MPFHAEVVMTAATEATIQWTEDVDKALSDSKKSGKPLILDFTAAPM